MTIYSPKPPFTTWLSTDPTDTWETFLLSAKTNLTTGLMTVNQFFCLPHYNHRFNLPAFILFLFSSFQTKVQLEDGWCFISDISHYPAMPPLGGPFEVYLNKQHTFAVSLQDDVFKKLPSCPQILYTPTASFSSLSKSLLGFSVVLFLN